jgi:ankyrin repeat protein
MRARHFRGLAIVIVLFALAFGTAAPAAAASRQIPLIEAVKKGDVTAVRALLRTQVDVNATEPDGTTALHWAAHRNDGEIIDLLIKAGANVKVVNRYGASPFSLACLKGNAAAIERLLQAGETANAILGNEHVLMMTARSGNVAAVKSLLAHGANPNYQEPSQQQTALMWAAARGHVGVVKALLEAGASVSARSKAVARDRVKEMAGRTPRINDPLGLRANRDPSWAVSMDGLEFTPLLFAARGGHIGVVNALLDAGANVNDAKTNDNGTTALILAIMNHHWELAGVLVDRGANPNLGPGYTALHQVAWSRRLNHGFGPEHPEDTGNLDSLNLAKKLIAHGVDLNAKATQSFHDGYRNRFNRIGATAFLMSAKLVDVPMMKLLVEKGADIHITNEDRDTPLMVAAGVALHNPQEDAGTEGEVMEAVKYLLDLGFDVNAVNKNNETAMHGAAYRGFNTVAQFLYDKGAKIDVPNILGWTPLTIADGLFYTGFYKAAPETATLIRSFYAKNGLPVPPLPKVNDTSLLTLDSKAAEQYNAVLKEEAARVAAQAEAKKRAQESKAKSNEQ